MPRPSDASELNSKLETRKLTQALASPAQSNSLERVSDLIRRVEDSIIQKALLTRGQNVLVGVSGGLDSMVLLHVLHHLSQQYRWHLRAAHFNHQLRGRSSDADERLVRRIAERLGVPFVAGRADVKRFAGQKRLSIEMAARQLRHDFL